LFSRIHKYSAEGKFLKAWGIPGSRNGELLVPTDIALDNDGNVYVVEADNRRVQKFSSDGQFITKWGGGQPDSAEGQFYYPQSIAVDSQGRVFVSDIANQRISIFAADGTLIADWNSTALSSSGPSDSSSRTGFYEARSLAFDTEDNLYMVDSLNTSEPPYTLNRIAKFSETRELLASWDSFGNENLSTSISSMTIDAENNVYVTDNSKNTIMKFTGDGIALTKWSYTEQDSGSSSQVGAITVDPSGLVYVADPQNNRILVFGPEGSPALADRAPTINVPAGELLSVDAPEYGSFFVNVTYQVTASDDRDEEGSIIPSCTPPSGSSFPVGFNMTVSCVAVDSSGNAASKSFIVSVEAPMRPEVQIPEFKEQYGLVSSWGSAIDVNELYLQAKAVAIDNNNDDVYILTYGAHPVQKYDRNGTSLGAWGSLGAGEGQLGNPSGIAVDSTNKHVYVTDFEGAKVVVFGSTNGTFMEEWGTVGGKDGQFSNPYGIAVDSDGFVYVVDSGNQRVQKFGPDGEFITKWSGGGAVSGNNSTQTGEFMYPQRIAIQEDAAGATNQTFVYITDSGASNVQKFTSDGTFITSWTSGQDPEGVAFDPRNKELYVADFVGVGIDKYDDSGGYLDTILNSTNDRDGSTLFYNPTDIAIDSEGSVYVASSGPVLKFNSTLDLSLVIRYAHASTGAFYDPFRIAIDETTGNLHVADSGYPRIQTFNSNGTLVKQWEPINPLSDDYLNPTPVLMSDMATNSQGVVYVLGQKVYMFDRDGEYLGEWRSSLGQGISELSGPVGLAIDSKDNVVIASAGDYSIKKFSPDGQYLLGWKTDDPIANPDTASPPSNIAIDSSDNIYVLDMHFDRIKVYTPVGDFIKIWNNSRMTGGGEQATIFDPYAPRAVAIAIDKEDNVYLSYTGGHIRKFFNNGTFLTDIGPSISNEAQSHWLPDMAVSKDSGHLYVIDGTHSKIAILSSNRATVIPEFNAILLPILLVASMAAVIATARWKSIRVNLEK
jgi:DNA-binding beta-propeller fold protein YncE